MVGEIYTFLGHNMVLAAEEGRLAWCNWCDDIIIPSKRHNDSEDKDHEVIRLAATQLEEYLAGQRREFTIPLRVGGTEFQRRVWSALLEIPYGATITYGELARRIGTPNGRRAVARACGANHIDIIIPCHRVISSSGLGGYTGPTDIKTTLLTLEQTNTTIP